MPPQARRTSYLWRGAGQRRLARDLVARERDRLPGQIFATVHAFTGVIRDMAFTGGALAPFIGEESSADKANRSQQSAHRRAAGGTAFALADEMANEGENTNSRQENEKD